MRPLTVSDAASMVFGLQQEIQRSEESRYDHRLQGVLLVAQGMTCPEVGRLLGDAPRTVEYRVCLASIIFPVLPHEGMLPKGRCRFAFRLQVVPALLNFTLDLC